MKRRKFFKALGAGIAVATVGKYVEADEQRKVRELEEFTDVGGFKPNYPLTPEESFWKPQYIKLYQESSTGDSIEVTSFNKISNGMTVLIPTKYLNKDRDNEFKDDLFCVVSSSKIGRMYVYKLLPFRKNTRVVKPIDSGTVLAITSSFY